LCSGEVAVLNGNASDNVLLGTLQERPEMAAAATRQDLYSRVLTFNWRAPERINFVFDTKMSKSGIPSSGPQNWSGQDRSWIMRCSTNAAFYSAITKKGTPDKPPRL